MSIVIVIWLLLPIVFLILLIIKNRKYKKLEKLFISYNINSIDDAQRKLKFLSDNYESEIRDKNNVIASLNSRINTLNSRVELLHSTYEENSTKTNDLQKKLDNLKIRFQKSRDLYSAMEKAITEYYDAPLIAWKALTDEQKSNMDSIAPTVLLSLNSMNYKELRKQFSNNQKQIEELLNQFKSHYTSKSNHAIYQLMTIALMSELQNILIALKYGKLEEKIQDVRTIIGRFISIAEDGNQTIASTVKKFAYALQNLFENAVNIEYEYYVKREQARQEQLELKAKMREEREEQKRLEEQAVQFAKEQEKYLQEKERLEARLKEAQEEDKQTLEEAISQIETQLTSIEEKKEEITKLQHGKAGNVYIISNIGSFGDDVFKIGMTRRLVPQERIDELGTASVPFNFDVHSFIFSNDAVGLETELHHRLDERRVNKVNKRKEFFRISIDELESLVNEVYPSAEFNKTALAEQYRQSLALDKNDFIDDSEIDEDENDNEDLTEE